MADERTRYSDAELEEFKQLILKKLESARADYELLRATITHTADNDTEDTSPTFKVLEEGAATLSKEESGRLAAHQMKFIRNLEMALVRIENKTYGICKTTGKLIPKERLMKVPHATECIEPKKAASDRPGRKGPHSRCAPANLDSQGRTLSDLPKSGPPHAQKRAPGRLFGTPFRKTHEEKDTAATDSGRTIPAGEPLSGSGRRLVPHFIRF